MKFTPSTSRLVLGEGDPSTPIAIVGEAPGAEEAKQGKPFVGPAGNVLQQCMHSAGLIRSDAYLTNVVKERPPGNKIDPFFRMNNQGKGWFTERGEEYVEALLDELEGGPNVVVACGNVALAALTGLSKPAVSKYRGYVMEGKRGLKVIPTMHPAYSLRGNYISRFFIINDLIKARMESPFPEIIRPVRDIVIPDSYSLIVDWLEYLKGAVRLSVDIEVINYEVSCIGFSECLTSGTDEEKGRGISIPLAVKDMLTLEEEMHVWRLIAEVLGNPDVPKVMQNGIFDIHFLASRCGIIVRGALEDTMMAHGVMFPEFPKSLAFLVSMYCGAQEYYKDMVHFNNIKEDA